MPLELDAWIKEKGEGNRTRTIVKALRLYREEHDRRIKMPVPTTKELEALLGLAYQVKRAGGTVNSFSANLNTAALDPSTRLRFNEVDIRDTINDLRDAAKRIDALLMFWCA